MIGVSMIYLDHHATTPVDSRVLDVMLPYFCEHPGNAASRNHSFGRTAFSAVETARGQVASLIGGSAREIAFTSGATESDNLAIKGVAEALRERGDHIITQRTEHKAVLDSARRLERRGFRVTILDVDSKGLVDPDALRAAMSDKTILVSVMWTNNETGAAQDLAALGAITRERGVYLHCDASQGLGYIPLDVGQIPVDLVSFTAHKVYGPKGVGALYARRRNPRVSLVAEIDGGGHEFGMRSGTLNVPGIVGFGAACALQRDESASEAIRIRALRETLFTKLEGLGGVLLNGPSLDGPRHPGNLNVSIDGLDPGGLMVEMAKSIAVSSGSACSTGSGEPSYVLRAMGLSRDRAASSIRYGLGRSTSESDIDTAFEVTRAAVTKLRASYSSAPAGW